jgi:hypothetical protein
VQRVRLCCGGQLNAKERNEMLKEYFRANPRVAGLFLIAFSLGLGKFFMYDVMIAAQAHADNVTVTLSRSDIGSERYKGLN